MTTTNGISIAGGDIATSDGIRPGAVTVEDGLIAADGPRADDGSVSIDADGLVVSPGFIDLQINGGFGIDLLENPTAMWELGRLLPRHGVTAFLPTIITSPPERTEAALAGIGARPPDHVGAEPLGLHLEGPMLNPRRKGAHPVAHMVRPDPALVDGWRPDRGVVLVTLAPELPGATEVIKALAGRGVTVSAGHSDADGAQAMAGIEAGVTMVTHLFNAMAPLGHREPNLAGVALAAPELVTGLIVDGVHIDPIVVAAAWNAKGPSGLVLVTDAVAPMGMGPGRYEFARITVTTDGLSVRTEDGTLAGSVLTMDQALRNLMAYTGCRLADGLRPLTETPAALIGAEGRGRIEVGAIADLTMLDRELEVALTMSRGRLTYVADDAGDRLPGPLLEQYRRDGSWK